MPRMQDLPVSVDLPPALAAEVSAFVETEAGWQVVGADGPPAPVLALTAAPTAGACVVITDGVPAPERVAGALLAGALDVVAWPQDRQRLLSAPLRVRDGSAGLGPVPAVVGVAGAGGGAGTSTVALAAGGVAAWAGARVLVVGGDDLLRLAGIDAWSGPGAEQLATLPPADAAAEVAGLARRVAGVDGLDVLGGGGVIGPLHGWPYDVVVVDRRCPPRLAGANLVVARLDASVREAAGAAAPVLVRARGPAPAAAVRRALGRPPAAFLAESARVARAGLAGRVPSALPGSWLAGVRAGLRAVAA